MALTLISIILGAIYGTFFLSHKAMEGMDQSLVRLQECRMAMDMICREIESTSSGKDRKDFVFKIEDRDLYGKQASRLTLRAFSPLAPGEVAISYYVEEIDGKLTLLKKMDTFHRSGTEEEALEIIEEIEAFTVEAREGDRWVKTWDVAETKAIPEEVRITITALLKDRRLSFFERARPRIGREI